MLILLLAMIVVLLNLGASVFVLRVPELRFSQRCLQLALVWLVPVVGAVVCLAFVSSLVPRGIAGAFDPLHHPSDGGAPDNSCHAVDGCGSSSGGDGGD